MHCHHLYLSNIKQPYLYHFCSKNLGFSKQSPLAVGSWCLSGMTFLMQVDVPISVGIEAFSRIAPAVPIISNVIISENLFELLTASNGGRLQFSIYDKYLIALER